MYYSLLIISYSKKTNISMALWRRTGEKKLPIVGAVAAGLRVLSLGSDIVGRCVAEPPEIAY